MLNNKFILLLLTTSLLISCESSKLNFVVFDKSYACTNSTYFEDRYLQLRNDKVAFYVQNSYVSNLCVKGTWKKNEDTIFLNDFEPYIMYHPDTALKTFVLELEDTLQSINIGNRYDFNAIKNFVINGKDTLKNYLTSDSTLNYTKRLFSITTNEPETYYYDTTKTYKVDIHQFVLIRPSYTSRIEEFDIPKYFIRTKKGLKYTSVGNIKYYEMINEDSIEVKSDKYSEELVFKKISNQLLNKKVFYNYILIDKEEVLQKVERALEK